MTARNGMTAAISPRDAWRALRPALLVLAVLLPGCCDQDGLENRPPGTPAQALIDGHNQRVRAVGMLWSPRVKLIGHFRPAASLGGRDYDLDGQLLYQAPHNLLLRAEVAGTEILRLGSNAERYWFAIRGRDASRMWWGQHRYIDQPCAQRVALRPGDVLAALSLEPIELARGEQVVGMSTSQHDAVLIQAETLRRDRAGQLVVPDKPRRARAYLFSRATGELAGLIAYSDDGCKIVRRAWLSDYAPLATARDQPAYVDPDLLALGLIDPPTTAPAQQAAQLRVPRRIEIEFDNYRDSGSGRMSLQLDSPRDRHQFDPAVFDFPALLTAEQIRLDAGCDELARSR